MKEEKVRVNELGPEDEEDPELREIINESIRWTNRSNERMEKWMANLEGGISPDEMRKLKRERKEDEKILRELNRRLKEYKKRKAKG